MDPISKFAAEAAAFERWLLTGTDVGADAARNCLLLLLNLYQTGIVLPSGWSNDLEEIADIDRVSGEEWRVAYNAARRLPLDFYGEVFDPTEVPVKQEPVVGSLSDDLADIYRDVVTGLRAFEQGRRVEAVWEWNYNLCNHWGAHATGAIRALHWWLSSNSPDRLSGDRQA